MKEDAKLVEARNEVLRKIGRNVVTFQKMEAMLELLTSLPAVINGPVAEFERRLSTRRKTKRTLGRLVEEHIQTAVQPKDATDGHEDASAISFNVRLEDRLGSPKVRKRELRAVVAARNNLIHKRLASFDPDSMESCQALAVDLDREYAKASPEASRLRTLVQMVRQMGKAIKVELNKEIR